MKRLWLWLRLLTKRHFARPAFLTILLLIPVLTAALALFSGADSGIVTVALSPGSSEFGKRTCAELTEHPGILRFLTFDGQTQAREAVAHGQADAAWIFPDDAPERLHDFTKTGATQAVVVVEREENVFLRLSRETLFAQLYPSLSRLIFTDCAEESFGVAEQALLDECYETSSFDGPIIEMAYSDGSHRAGGESVLLSPIRGLLTMLVMLAAFASGLGCCREEAAGCFDPLPRTARRLVPLLSHLTAALPTALCTLPALALAGLWTGLARESAIALLLSLSASCFAELVRTLCRAERVYAAAVPILMMLMVTLCPVFLNFRKLRTLQYLLPPFYAINGAQVPRFVLWLALYTLALCAVTIPLRLLRIRTGE